MYGGLQERQPAHIRDGLILRGLNFSRDTDIGQIDRFMDGRLS
jgi:hypothetical protein